MAQDWRDVLQRVNDLPLADVAGVDDELDSLEHFRASGLIRAVGIGNEADHVAIGPFFSFVCEATCLRFVKELLP